MVAHGAIGRDRRRLAQPIATLNPTLKEIACAEEPGFIARRAATPRRRIASTTTCGAARSGAAATMDRREAGRRRCSR